MDRREALKKMAIGGATVVGASVIVSGTAFADGGSVNSRPTGTAGGTVTLTAALTTDKGTRTISAVNTTPAGSCPFGSPTTPRKEYAWSLVNGTDAGSISGTAFSTTLASQTATATSGTWNGNFTVRLTIRWVCDQGNEGVSAAWRCRSFAVLVTAGTPGPNGTVSNGATTEDGTALNCNSPVPAPS